MVPIRVPNGLETLTSAMSSKTGASINFTSPHSTRSTSPLSTSTSTRNRAVSVAIEPLTEEEIETKPWKYIGYKGYSDFIASENDFYIVRRFASLNTRVSLALQDQVTVLEEQLDELDKQYSRRDAEDLHNGTFRDDREDRTALVEKISEKLMKYSELNLCMNMVNSLIFEDSFILQQTEIKKYPPAFKHDLKSVRNWHYNHGVLNGPILSEEQKYLDYDHDLVCVVPKEKTPLRQLFDRSKKFRIHPFWKSNKAPELPVYDQDVIMYTSDKRIDRFITVVIIGIGTVMLLVPMWILNAVNNNNIKLAVITAFVVVFLGLVSYATVAKPFETLAATAAQVTLVLYEY